MSVDDTEVWVYAYAVLAPYRGIAFFLDRLATNTQARWAKNRIGIPSGRSLYPSDPINVWGVLVFNERG